jgi:hypothetical protein
MSGDVQSMPVKASNMASSFIKRAESRSGAKRCLAWQEQGSSLDEWAA